MKSGEDIRRYTPAELDALRAERGPTDLSRAKAKTEAELERDIAADPDWRDIPRNWHEAAVAVTPIPKKLLSLRLDTDVVDWFRRQGPGYQTRINAVLRIFVERQVKQK